MIPSRVTYSQDQVNLIYLKIAFIYFLIGATTVGIAWMVITL